ncbi:MAG: BsuPI-related putative proteinase inhibitor [Terrimicrobiaceae bacterium]|nr:BsuPI-related putative proteinase inhibitor [Terrimicrobiaceae bacterium]
MHVSRLLTPLLAGAALGSLGIRPAHAQDAVPVIPEKESPFFVLNDENENPGQKARRELDSPANQYPRNKSGDQSASKMFTSFFTDMFSTVHLVKAHSESKLLVEPKSFSLDDRREIVVTYTVFNRTAKLVKLDFPTSQRIEILVRDGNGKVLEKWSDDRAFDDISGVVMINPGERIQYEEKIATRDMQPGQTYTIEASLANNPEFTRTAIVTPTGKPRGALPNPTPDAAPPAPAQPLAQPTPSQG